MGPADQKALERRRVQGHYSCIADVLQYHTAGSFAGAL